MKKFTLRFTEEQYNKIQTLSNEAGVSMNAYISEVLDIHTSTSAVARFPTLQNEIKELVKDAVSDVNYAIKAKLNTMETSLVRLAVEQIKEEMQDDYEAWITNCRNKNLVNHLDMALKEDQYLASKGAFDQLVDKVTSEVAASDVLPEGENPMPEMIARIQNNGSNKENPNPISNPTLNELREKLNMPTEEDDYSPFNAEFAENNLRGDSNEDNS